MRISKKYSFVILFIVLFLLYFFFESIMFEEIIAGPISYDTYSIISASLFVILMLHIVYFPKVRLMKVPFVRNYMTLTVISYSIMVFYSLFNPLDSRITYMSFLLPLFFLIFIYQISMVLDGKTVNYLILLLVCLLAINYFKVYSVNHFNNWRTMAPYIFLFFMPFLLTVEKKIIKYIGILIIFVIVAISIKRTAFLGFTLGVITYFGVDKVLIKKNKAIGVFLFALIVSILLILILYMIETYNIEIIDRFKEIEEDGGSGRDIVFMETLILIIKSSLPEIAFGHGFDMVANNNAVSAHNEFLEITYDYGIISLFIFIVFIVNLINYLYKLIKLKSKYAPQMAASIIIFLISSTFSHTYLYTKHMIIFTLFWGYVIACVKKEQSNF